MPTNPNMVAIQTVTVGAGGASSIDFTNIPATYTDLVLKLSLRDNRSGSVIDGALLRFNNDTTSGNYTGRRLLGDGSNASSSTSNVAIFANAADSTASTFSNTEVYIPNYTGNTNKSYSTDTVQETNGTTSYMALSAGLWSNTAAITSIKITPEIGTTFNQYSTATLYGVTSAGTAAKATGGIITMDDNYIYHTFLASGTFTPTVNLTADYLVVAGGGSGGDNRGGGGGAGGLRCTVTATGGGGSLESPLSLTALTNYTVTIGAGGAFSANGNNSVFSTITSTGGGLGGRLFGDGASGGSGGGGSLKLSGNGDGGAGTANQGYAGGTGADYNVNTTGGGGGGGGAGAVGVTNSGNSTNGMNGGAGVATSISGSSVTYAGGGGGGPGSGGQQGTGGAGGGGNSGNTGVAGTANRGGGGGASEQNGGNGGAGGSGIVIVRYAR